MTPKTIGNISEENIKAQFKFVNGKCLPWKNNIQDIYNVEHQENIDINECMILSKIKGMNKNILDNIVPDDRKGKKGISILLLKKIPSWVSGVNI